MDSDDESVMSTFSMGGVDSDAFSPEEKPKAKPAKETAAAKPTAKTAAKPAPKKLAQTKLTVAKKRAKPESDDEDGATVDTSGSPPSAKKAKKAASKKPAKPGREIENESMVMDDDDSQPAPTNKTDSEKFQKLTQIEHIIKRPDTYIGSVESTDQQMWVFNRATARMEHRTVSYVPGIYKIFDEIIVNAADNKQRDSTMSYIKVNVDREEGSISIENDGKGIPVVIHTKENVYIPELVFGHLLAGSNFDDKEKKTVGGRNGFGAKLCNVFSTEFTLECQDSVNGKRYKQVWTNNMSNMSKAKISSNKSKDFVRVAFKPDFARFGMPGGIDDDLESLLYRRVYDMAGTVKGIKVYLNGELIKLKNFESYCEMYAKAIAQDRDAEQGPGSDCKVWVDKDKGHPRWEVGFAVSDGSFQHVSFVNSIATTSGGTHINYIADQICQYLLKTVTKRMKGHSLKANNIRNHIFIFVNCFITNPAFNSQTKEVLTTKPSAFGSKCVLGEDFLKKIATSEAIANILAFAEKKADKMLAKSDGSKRSRINNAKLTEANFAGTKKGYECTLILTEGDSAKGLAVSGRAILDPDRIGVFPLRGKMLNVRDASIDQITKNSEIQMIKQILGLKHKQEYTDTKALRYGHLMIMADQDHDGSHIKGLLINFLQVQFPSLLKIPDFFQEFITPIVKVWRGPNPKDPRKLKWFFTQPEYDTWKKVPGNDKWETKYLKGLGSSSNEDAQRYFAHLDDHLKQFETMRPEEAEMFELAFSKKKADARKEWLGRFVPGTFLDHSSKSITYSDFVNKELILFSMADNIRSIPSALDGFKPGQRKVLYACFLRNVVKDMKVYELSGYVSQKTDYHHGETSLQQTIVGLAQDFVGSNNINCLEPSGNFGSRLAGGGDAASPRYIFTRLSPFARKVFSTYDEPILDWQWEDGKQIEPKTYAPVIPMVLANGADGIGTGWSTSIPNYHPKDIVDNLKRRMGRLDPGDDEEKPFVPMMPWFRGWKGAPEAAAPDRYKFNGIVEYNPDRPTEVVISELPIRTWTDDFKDRLEEIIAGTKGPSWIKDYKEFNDHQNVNFEISLDKEHVKAVLRDGLLERFKLLKQVATSNLVAFDTRGQIRKYANVEQIMEEFYHYRFGMYTKRKAHWLSVLDADFRRLQNQARFVKEIIDGMLIVGKKKKSVLVTELRERDYEAFPPKGTNKKSNDDEEEDGSAIEEDEEQDNIGGARDYDYLLSMPIWSLTAERLEKLRQQLLKKRAEHDELKALSEKDLWCRDLDALMEVWDKEVEERHKIKKNIRGMGRRASKKIGAGADSTKRGPAAKGDAEYSPVKAKAAPRAKPVKVESKTHERFAEKFGAIKVPKPKLEDDDDDLPEPTKAKASKPPKAKKLEPDSDDGFTDDDLAVLGGKKAVKAESKGESTKAATGRAKRTAASKAKTWIDEDSESNDDSLIGDVGALVKGIGNPETSSNGGRLSLFSMSRRESIHGDKDKEKEKSLPKTVKSKSSKTFDFDTDDDTNYELLAKPSPQKPPKQSDVMKIDSDDGDDFAVPKAQSALAAKPLTIAPVKKAGRPAGFKNKDEDEKEKEKPKPKPAAKPLGQSPAAKAYAAKAKKAAAAKVVISDDEDEESELDSPPPRPAGRVRPARAVVANKPKPKYVVESEDEEDEKDEEDEEDEGDEEDDNTSDDFEDDDDD